MSRLSFTVFALLASIFRFLQHTGVGLICLPVTNATQGSALVAISPHVMVALDVWEKSRNVSRRDKVKSVAFIFIFIFFPSFGNLMLE
jgi:hypothetical protein